MTKVIPAGNSGQLLSSSDKVFGNPCVNCLMGSPLYGEALTMMFKNYKLLPLLLMAVMLLSTGSAFAKHGNGQGGKHCSGNGNGNWNGGGNAGWNGNGNGNWNNNGNAGWNGNGNGNWNGNGPGNWNGNNNWNGGGNAGWNGNGPGCNGNPGWNGKNWKKAHGKHHGHKYNHGQWRSNKQHVVNAFHPKGQARAYAQHAINGNNNWR